MLHRNARTNETASCDNVINLHGQAMLLQSIQDDDGPSSVSPVSVA